MSAVARAQSAPSGPCAACGVASATARPKSISAFSSSTACTTRRATAVLSCSISCGNSHSSSTQVRSDAASLGSLQRRCISVWMMTTAVLTPPSCTASRRRRSPRLSRRASRQSRSPLLYPFMASANRRAAPGSLITAPSSRSSLSKYLRSGWCWRGSRCAASCILR
eukprot:6210378-Pleurochrysis_carterae.AAC.5